jgi:hypothetical protein
VASLKELKLRINSVKSTQKITKAKQMVAAMVNPPRSLELVLRTTLISTGLILPALFFRVQGLFD